MPENSHDASARRPSAVKSMWSMPGQCTGVECLSASVCGVAEVEPLEALGDDDRAIAARREVEVVRIGDRARLAVATGERVDRRQGVAPVAVDPQRAQVPRGRDVLRLSRDAEASHDLERARIDLVDGVALRLGDVDAVERCRADAAIAVGPSAA